MARRKADSQTNPPCRTKRSDSGDATRRRAELPRQETRRKRLSNRRRTLARPRPRPEARRGAREFPRSRRRRANRGRQVRRGLPPQAAFALQAATRGPAPRAVKMLRPPRLAAPHLDRRKTETESRERARRASRRRSHLRCAAAAQDREPAGTAGSSGSERRRQIPPRRTRAADSGCSENPSPTAPPTCHQIRSIAAPGGDIRPAWRSENGRHAPRCAPASRRQARRERGRHHQDRPV